MRRAIVSIQGISPYSPSAHFEAANFPGPRNELPGDQEKRLWRERINAKEDGTMFIPPMAFKNAISSAASAMGERVKGKGMKTYTKIFEAGLMVMEPLLLPAKKDEVLGEWLFVPSDGRRGGGKRVSKCFARVDKWGGDVVFHVFHDAIGEDVFRRHIEYAGMFIGVGRFRPQNNGFYGRFQVQEIVWDSD